MKPVRAYGLITSAGDAQPVAVLVDARRDDVVVEPAPVVPREEDGGRVPVGPAHDGVDQAGHPGLAGADERAGVLADVRWLGTTHDTDGSVPPARRLKK